MDEYYNNIYAIALTEEKAKELIEEMKTRRSKGEYFPSEMDCTEYEVDVILNDD